MQRFIIQAIGCRHTRSFADDCTHVQFMVTLGYVLVNVIVGKTRKGVLRSKVENLGLFRL